jgi:hypothetical protein
MKKYRGVRLLIKQKKWIASSLREDEQNVVLKNSYNTN